MVRTLEKIWPTKQVEGYSENYTFNGSSLTEVFEVPWATHISDVGLLLASSPSDTVSFPLWECTGVSATNMGWENAASVPTEAQLTVTYKDTIAAAEEGAGDIAARYSDWIESWQSGGEAITVGKGCRWSDTGELLEKEDISTVCVFPQVQLTMTGKTTATKFNTYGKVAVLNTIGKTNSAAVTIKGYSYPIETLLFLGDDANEVMDAATGNSAYNMSLKFSVSYGHTWNEFWNGSTFAALVDEDGDPLYTATAFSAINPDEWKA